MRAVLSIALVLLFAVLVAVEDVSAQERRRRPPAFYNERVQWHRSEHEEQVPFPGQDDSERIRHLMDTTDDVRPSFRPNWQEEQMSLSRSAFYVPQLPVQQQRTTEDDRRRNWLVLDLEGAADGRPRVSDDEDRREQPSGWGWLADAVEAGRREQMERRRDEEETTEDDELTEWFIRNQAGLMSTIDAMGGAVFLNANNEERTNERRQDRDTRTDLDRWAVGEHVSDQNRPDPSRESASDPRQHFQARTSTQEQSVWDEESTVFQSEHYRAAVTSPFGSSDDRRADSESRFSPWGESQNAWSRTDSGAGSRRAGEETTRAFTRIPDSSSSRPMAESSRSDPFSSTSESRWSSDWSTDTNWQQPQRGSSQPSALSPAPSRSADRQSPLRGSGPLPHQSSSWLASPPDF